jgi:hypothetical protein
VRLYRRTDGPVLPFLHLAATARYGSRSQPDAWHADVGVGVGIGAEWFPAESVGIAGSTGVRANYAHDRANDTTTMDAFSIGAFRSEPTLTLYF